MEVNQNKPCFLIIRADIYFNEIYSAALDATKQDMKNGLQQREGLPDADFI